MGFLNRDASPFCCSLFADAVQNAGQGGTAILATRLENGTPLFQLQHRVTSVEEHRLIDDELRALTARYSVCLKIASAQTVSYCPWCGTKVARTISRLGPRFSELVEKHRPLVLAF